MVLHILKGNAYHLSLSIIESFLKNIICVPDYKGDTHHFIILSLGDKMLYDKNLSLDRYIELFQKYNYTNYELVYKKIDFYKIIFKKRNLNNKFFFHGSVSPFLIQIFLYIIFWLFFRKKLNTICLIAWGQSDFLISENSLFYTLVNKLLSFCLRTVDKVLVLSPGDEKLYNSVFQKQCIQLSYISDRSICRIDRNNTKIVVMVSHSGWSHNNHIAIFNMLKKHSKSIRVICPLCYGDKDYIEKVVKKGKEIFDDNFEFFTDLKPRQDYINLINTVDVFISGAEIQTGLFAVMTSLLSGANIYVTGNLKESLDSYGFTVNSVSELVNINTHELGQSISEEIYKRNIDVYLTKYQNKNALIENWKRLF